MLTPAQCEALNAAADVLETEANQLSYYISDKLKTTLGREGLVQDAGPESPHRVSIAVASEMRRLRNTASTLRSMLPRPQIDEDES